MAEIGTTIYESVANGINSGSSVSTRNIGILMARERGIAGVPTLITTPKEDSLYFGGYNDTMYGPYVMRNLFDNLAGFSASIYGCRVVGDGSTAASGTLKNSYEDAQVLVTATTIAAASGVAQVNTITPGASIDIGDTYSITKGATTVSFVATAATLSNVLTGLLAAIVAEQTANPSGDFSDVTASNTGTEIKLTATVANTPFTQTSAASNSTSAPEIATITAGRAGSEDVGTWGNDLKVIAYPKGHVDGINDKYLMNVFYKNIKVESFSGETWTLVASQVNQYSNYITMSEESYSQALDRAAQTIVLSGGTYVAPIEADFNPAYDEISGEPLGLAAFESIDVQILACTEVFSVDFSTKAEQFCADSTKGKKRFFYHSMPYLASESTAAAYSTALATSGASHASGYLNWCEVSDGGSDFVWIPAIGYLLACAVRTAGLNDGRVWTPNGGTATRAYGIRRFTHTSLTNFQMDRYVKNYGVNVVKYIKGTGNCIWSSRTYSTNSLHVSQHVRLLTNWLAESLVDRNNRFGQKLITSSLLNEIKADNYVFMRGIYDQGGLENTISFDKCVDISVTTNQSDRKQLDMDILYIPTECNEAMRINLARNDGSFNANN